MDAFGLEVVDAPCAAPLAVRGFLHWVVASSAAKAELLALSLISFPQPAFHAGGQGRQQERETTCTDRLRRIAGYRLGTA